MTLSQDIASCPREGPRLCCKPKGLGNNFCTEHDDKNVDKYPNITEASWWPLTPEALCLPPSTLLGSGCSVPSGSFSIPFFPAQWHNLSFAWLCFLSHILPSHTPGKLAKTWKIIWLWPWGLSLPSQWEEYEGEGGPRKGEEKWAWKLIFLFRFLNCHVFNYDISLPLSQMMSFFID